MAPALGFPLEVRKQGYELRAENGCLSGLVQILQQKPGVSGQGRAHLIVDPGSSPSYQGIPLPPHPVGFSYSVPTPAAVW